MTCAMRCAVAIAALAALQGGCFTSWAVSQATGKARIWDEQVREEAVPMPGLTERLVVTMPLGIEMAAPPMTTAATPAPATPRPFAFTCLAEQTGQDAVYHSAFRYGRGWKKGTAVMFLLEGLAATGFYFASREEGKEANVLFAAYFGADALGTAALFFAPRKEIYRRDVRDVRTPIRGDCPATLALQIGGDTFPLDAAGRLGELGDLALDDWMQAPTGPLLLGFEGRTFELVVADADRCTWNRARQRPPAPGCAYAAAPQQTVATVIDTTPGTLTRTE